MHIFLESCTTYNDQNPILKSNRFVAVDLFISDHNIRSVKEFYNSNLNLPIISESSKGFSIQAGKTRINFKIDNSIKKPFYHIAFNIPENKIVQAKKWSKGRFDLLSKENGEDIIHFKKWNAHSIYFMDPVGNILEFIAHHKLNNKSTGDFSSNDILYLIEIGIVSEDVISLAQEIKNKTGLVDYIKTDGIFNSSNFRAIGDTSGMLILSRTDRNWLMTDIPAQEIPVNIKMKSNRKEIVHLEKGKYKIEML